MHAQSFRSARTDKLLFLFLSVAANHVQAFPASPLPLDVASDNLDISLNANLTTFDMNKLHCDDTLGKLDYEDCDEAIKLMPHDPIGKPVVRNFYVSTSDVSTSIPNQQLPFEQSYGG